MHNLQLPRELPTESSPITAIDDQFSFTDYLKKAVSDFEHISTPEYGNARKLIQFYLQQFLRRDFILNQVKSDFIEVDEKKRETIIYVFQKTWVAQFKILIILKHLDREIVTHFSKLREIFIDSVMIKDHTPLLMKKMHNEIAFFLLSIDEARKKIGLEILHLFQNILPKSLLAHETWKFIASKITYDFSYKPYKEPEINSKIYSNKIIIIDEELHNIEDLVKNTKKLYPHIAYLLNIFYESLRDKMIFIKNIYEFNTTVTDLEQYYASSTPIVEKIYNGLSKKVSSSTAAFIQATTSGMVNIASQFKIKTTPESIKELSGKLVKDFEHKIEGYDAVLANNKKEMCSIYLLSQKPIDHEDFAKAHKSSYILIKEEPVILWFINSEGYHKQNEIMEILDRDIFDECKHVEESVPLQNQSQITGTQLNRILNIIFSIYPSENFSSPSKYSSNYSFYTNLLLYPIYLFSCDYFKIQKSCFILNEEFRELLFLDDAGDRHPRWINQELCRHIMVECKTIDDSRPLQEQMTDCQFRRLLWALTLPPASYYRLSKEQYLLCEYSKILQEKSLLLSSPAVTIRIWETSPQKTGHVSLATDKIYASFWPAATSRKSFTEGVHAEWIGSPKEDEYLEGESGRPSPPDCNFKLFGLDVEAIEQEFKKIQKSNKIKWAFWDREDAAEETDRRKKIKKQVNEKIKRNKSHYPYYHEDETFSAEERQFMEEEDEFMKIKSSYFSLHKDEAGTKSSEITLRLKRFHEKLEEKNLSTVQEEKRLNCASLVYHLLQIGGITKKSFSEEEIFLMASAGEIVCTFNDKFLNLSRQTEEKTHQFLTSNLIFNDLARIFSMATTILYLSNDLPGHISRNISDYCAWSFPSGTKMAFDADRDRFLILLNQIFYHAVCKISESITFKEESMNVTSYITQDNHTFKTELDLLTKVEILSAFNQPKTICVDKYRFFDIDMSAVPHPEKKQETLLTSEQPPALAPTSTRPLRTIIDTRPPRPTDVNTLVQTLTASSSSSARLMPSLTTGKNPTAPPLPETEPGTLASSRSCLIL